MSRKYASRPNRRNRLSFRQLVRHCVLEALEPRCLLSGSSLQYPLYTVTGKATADPGTGFTPAQIQHAYGLDVTTLLGGAAADGTGTTVAIVDAYSNPGVVADLQAYSAYFNLPAPNITVVNQRGSSNAADLPAVNSAWTVEISLDVDAVHAVAPNANILLVETDSSSSADLYAGVAYAKSVPGVNVISMSFGSDESSFDPSFESVFKGGKGVTFVASTGDNGSYSPGTTTQIVSSPANFPEVVAAGGTSLFLDANGNYASESGWGNGTASSTAGGSGGGISAIFSQPFYQKGVVTQSTTQRTVPDISSAADPNTGFAVYDTYDGGANTPFITVGGTSWSSPTLAATFAIADQGRALNGKASLSSIETLSLLYTAPATDYNDITSGDNGYAAGTGYDLVTGRGTPIDNNLLPYLSTATPIIPPTPNIAKIVVNGEPNSITIRQNTQVILIAEGVSDPLDSNYTVSIYTETNGVPGLQAGATALFSATNQDFKGFTFIDTDPPGTYLYYARLVDDQGNTSADGTDATTFILTIRPQQDSNPTVSYLTPSSTAVNAGTPITFTASGIHDSGYSRNVQNVNFFLEQNATPGLQVSYLGYTGDFGLGSVPVPQSSAPIPVAAGSVTYTLDTTGYAPGTYTVYAQGVDDYLNTSASGTNATSATFTIIDPNAPVAATAALLTKASASAYRVSADSQFTVTVDASNSSDQTKLRYVTFYLEDNDTTGLQVSTPGNGGDTMIGRVVPTGNSTTVTESFFVNHTIANGTYTIYAVPTTDYTLSTPGRLNAIKIEITVTGNTIAIFRPGALQLGTSPVAANPLNASSEKQISTTFAVAQAALLTRLTDTTSSPAALARTNTPDLSTTDSTGNVIVAANSGVSYRTDLTVPVSFDLLATAQSNGGDGGDAGNSDETNPLITTSGDATLDLAMAEFVDAVTDGNAQQ